MIIHVRDNGRLVVLIGRLDVAVGGRRAATSCTRRSMTAPATCSSTPAASRPSTPAGSVSWSELTGGPAAAGRRLRASPQPRRSSRRMLHLTRLDRVLYLSDDRAGVDHGAARARWPPPAEPSRPYTASARAGPPPGVKSRLRAADLEGGQEAEWTHDRGRRCSAVPPPTADTSPAAAVPPPPPWRPARAYAAAVPQRSDTATPRCAGLLARRSYRCVRSDARAAAGSPGWP